MREFILLRDLPDVPSGVCYMQNPENSWEYVYPYLRDTKVEGVNMTAISVSRFPIWTIEENLGSWFTEVVQVKE